MAEIIDFQKIYSALGEMQSSFDKLFIEAVELSQFRSASVIMRFDISLGRNVDSTDILSDEYKNSAFAKNMADLSRNLIQSGPAETSSLYVRFIWSDAYYLMGSAALSPISRSNLANVYIQSVIRMRYRDSIQELFSNSDRAGDSSVPGKIRVVLQIEADGKVSQVSLVDQSLRGSLIYKNIQDMVKNWSFPGINSSVKVGISLLKPSLSGSSMASFSSTQIWVSNFGWISIQDLMNLSQSQSYSSNPWVSVYSPTLPLPPPREFPIFYATPSVPIPPPYSYSMFSAISGSPSQVVSWGHSGYWGDNPFAISSQGAGSSGWDPCMGNPCIVDPVPPSMRLPYIPISDVRKNVQGASVNRPSPDPYQRYIQSRYTLDYGVVEYGVLPPD